MPLIDSHCSKFQDYYFLGSLTKTNETEIECKNEKEDCIYVSLNIPAYAIGSFQSCSNDISKILTKIFNKRLDILDLFYQIKNNKTNLIEIDYFCNNYNNTMWVGNSMSGEIKIYTSCNKQNNLVNQTNIVKFNPPSSSAPPILCYNNEENFKICPEGYCSSFQISYLAEPIDFQQKISLITCPNEMYNYLEDFKCDNSLHQSLKNDLYNIGKHCASMDHFEKIVINGSYSYYYYVNCFNPSIKGNQTLPNIPILNDTNIDSSSCKKNTNIVNKKYNQCSLLLYLIFFKIIKDL